MFFFLFDLDFIQYIMLILRIVLTVRYIYVSFNVCMHVSCAKYSLY